MHYATTMSSDEEREEDDENEPEAEATDDDDEHLGLAPAGFRTNATVLPRVTWRGKFKKNVRASHSTLLVALGV